MTVDGRKGATPLPVRKLVSKMNRAMGRYKSAGVPVSAAVHGLIARGNAARTSGDWEGAALHYDSALAQAPHLTHIWIQLGHMRKQLEQYDQAIAAYAQAEAMDPQGEGAVEQGHVAKLQKQGGLAVQHYLRAYRSGGKNPDALRELLNLLERGTGMNKEAITSALQMDRVGKVRRSRKTDELASLTSLLAQATTLDLDATHVAALQEAQARLKARAGTSAADEGFDGAEIIFDASDLISYFGNARLPTGIQRVQIATITGAIHSRPEGSVKVCCFSDQGDSWAEVPIDSFLELCAMALESGDRTDPEWLEAYAQIKIEISLALPLEFSRGAFLINLGTSWWLQNYFMFVREARRLHGIHYIPFVHDFIPIMTPEHCVKELTQDFISWALGVYQHADFFLVNSEATKRDLITVADMLGHVVDASDVAVIPLDAEFRSPGAKVAPPARLRQWGLAADDYVLIVSTIESRKNHIGALDAWLALIQKHGARRVPKLVCVGNRGWLNDEVYARIDQSPLLRSRVVMLSGLSDEELGLLYKNCRFTLYPSNYEGWGLPVTESLCFGKVPLLSDSSSLPEAGGEFAVYFEAGSTKELTAKADQLIFDDAERARLEAKIKAGFRPRQWQDVSDQITREIETFVARIPVPRDDDEDVVIERIEPVQFGAHYPIVRNFERRIWKGLSSAEIYRSGTGWWWPDDWGCWTKPAGGDLALRFVDQRGPVRGFIQLHAPPDAESTFQISAPALGFHLEGKLKPGEFRWVAIDIAEIAPVEGFHIRFTGSHSVDVSERTGGLDRRVIALGVGGFYFCHADDLVARANFMEALTIGGLKQLAFNREPLPL
ncbi:glycosyltransferase family 4 protein [Sphingobium sp. CAP-1]|uniref:glycosyltransferase family 4 protein n=1 Tax=Sphingobium sp. CAP-1 TaxID=2676077 RepID=UPI0012BB4669|nr:glycosyltransferase family 1 protein [Sphingobium sp. CAP-1]QGP77597.1 glycosyltransferase [Sphingobium sp. CAP-1]